MPKQKKTRKDPLFEFVIVFAILLGGVFAFSSDTQQVEATPEVTPPAVEVVEEVKRSYVVPTGKPETLVTGLRAPWELLFLPDGQALVDERDTGSILLISKDLKVSKVGFTRAAPPCEKFCEGGTLGMTYAADRIGNKLSLFVFLTTLSDNRILKYDLNTDGSGKWSLANKRVIVKGIERSGKSTTHNGGRLAIGPDGKLWVTLGDSGMKGATS